MPQLGRYEILQRLARGSIADVLLARASGLEGFARHVVIKQIRPEQANDLRFVTAFLDEARIGASLHHQNIVQVFDVDEAAGGYFFAMEYVHGEDLRRVLAKVCAEQKLVPVELVVAIGAAAAAGLHHAHEHHGPDRKPLNLVHRDVSPSNILIGYDGSVKLVDFGLAKPALQRPGTRSSALGKAPYMSPEQCMGQPVDRRSDIFALGTVLYELVTARRLFKGTNDYLTMALIVDGTVPPPSSLRPEIPKQLEAIIMRALAKAPEARFQTADALRNALETFAIEHELRTSAKSVADYLESLFGARLEPWHTAPAAPNERPDHADVDFDAAHEHGLVSDPTHDVLETDPLAPIALARQVARTPDEAFDDEQPTRIDVGSDEDEEAMTVESAKPARTPLTPSSVATRAVPPVTDDDEHGSGETLTTAQPIIDTFATGGLGPEASRTAGNLLASAQAFTVSSSTDQRALDDPFGGSTLREVYPPNEGPTVRDPLMAEIPARSLTPRGTPIPAARATPQPAPRTTAPVTVSLRPTPSVAATPSAPATVSLRPTPPGASALPTPHTTPQPALVPRAPSAPAIALRLPQRQATDSPGAGVDEAATMEPPQFTPIYAPPAVHMPAPMSPRNRWALIASIVLLPIIIGMLAHACGDDRPATPPASTSH